MPNRHEGSHEGMDREYEIKIMGAELGDPSEVDLHDQVDTQSGVQVVDQFISSAVFQGDDVVRIIHGRGSGKMREAVHQLLKDHSLVEFFRDSSQPGEVMGVTYAVLVKQK